jgi:geranylgeranyl diphosphate synthase type II
VLAGAREGALTVLHRAGGDLGLAFQLVDDLIGAFGSSEQAGRESGSDLRESKRTPLVALARQTPAWAGVDHALAIAHTGPIAVRDAQRALEKSGARTQLRAVVSELLAGVRYAAGDAELSPGAGRLLGELADAVESRVP